MVIHHLVCLFKLCYQSILSLQLALAPSRQTKLFALVPVPLGNLIGGHADLAGDLDFHGVGPVRVTLKVVVQDLLLVRSLHHALAFFVLLRVIALQHQSHSIRFITARCGLLG